MHKGIRFFNKSNKKWFFIIFYRYSRIKFRLSWYYNNWKTYYYQTVSEGL